MNNRLNHPLTKRQKAALVQAARVAWEKSGQAERDRAASTAADPFDMAERDSNLFETWRRKTQLELTGLDSLTKCQQRHYRKLLDGWMKMASGDPTPQPGVAEVWPEGSAPANLWSDDRGPQLRKIGKLLANANRPWEYAHGIAQRVAKCERLDWCTSDQLRTIISILVTNNRKHGLPWNV